MPHPEKLTYRGHTIAVYQRDEPPPFCGYVDRPDGKILVCNMFGETRDALIAKCKREVDHACQ